MCRPVLLLVPVAVFSSVGVLALVPSPSAPSLTTNVSENSVGPERCLVSEAPMWCLAEEVGAGIARAFYAEGLALGSATGKGTSTDSFDMWTDMAARTFNLDFSSGTETEEVESRSRRKRKFAYIFVALATLMAVILPFKLKAIALMAATALFVGKLALIVASLVGLKKLVHKSSDELTHVHYSGHRSDPDAHYLAYGEHAPQYTNEERY